MEVLLFFGQHPLRIEHLWCFRVIQNAFLALSSDIGITHHLLGRLGGAFAAIEIPIESAGCARGVRGEIHGFEVSTVSILGEIYRFGLLKSVLLGNHFVSIRILAMALTLRFYLVFEHV